MARTDPIEIDRTSPPFSHLKQIRRLATERSGHQSIEHVRHHLYVGRDPSGADVLIKVASRPGLVYQANLTNEIASLTTINRELPDSRYFPVVLDEGRLDDGRVYLLAYLFSEFPLASTIGAERMPARTVGNLRIAIAVARALAELHSLPIIHVDLNPMNILYRSERGNPVIRIIDFESSYEPARHEGAFYDPPTTPRYSAPELSRQKPDARADVFSLGAVLYTLVAGYQWTWSGEAGVSIEADSDLDSEFKTILLTAVDANPDKRYPSIETFSAALAEYLERIWPGRS